MWACDSGHTDVVQELLSGGVQVDLQTEVRQHQLVINSLCIPEL